MLCLDQALHRYASAMGVSAAFVYGAKLMTLALQVLLFMRTFIFSAHDAARLMKANLEYDHYEAAPASSPQEDPKQLWQAVTVCHNPRPNT